MMKLLVSIADDGRAWHPDIILATLLGQDHEVRFLGWKRKSDREGTERCPSTLFRFPIGYANVMVAFGMPLWIAFATAAMMLTRSDVIHAIDLEAGLPAAISGLIRRRPFVYQVLDPYHLRHRWPKALASLFRWMERFVMRRAAWILVSDDDRITELELPFREKISVVYNSAPSEIERKTAVPRSGPVTILVTGLLLTNRGIVDLLEAVRSVPEIRILAAGEIPERELSAALQNHPQVEYRGILSPEDANKLYDESDCVFCFYDPSIPGYRAASSTKMFAAMAACVPSLVNSEQNKSKLVEESDIGYLAPYGDRKALVRVLNEIASDPDTRRAKGKRGFELHEKRFAWEIMKQRIAAVYRNLDGLKPK